MRPNILKRIKKNKNIEDTIRGCSRRALQYIFALVYIHKYDDPSRAKSVVSIRVGFFKILQFFSVIMYCIILYYTDRF